MQLDERLRTQPAHPPPDYKAWLGQRDLLRLCLEATHTLDWVPMPSMETSGPPYRPQMLMTLLTYCYASSVYSSEDVVAAAQTDWTVRYICGRARPDWHILRRFRQQHRLPLIQCLSWVLHQGVRLQHPDCHMDSGAIPSRAARQSARIRVETAALVDSLALDQ